MLFTHKSVFVAEFETWALLSAVKWKMFINFLNPPASPQFPNTKCGCEIQADFVDDLQAKSNSMYCFGSFFVAKGSTLVIQQSLSLFSVLAVMFCTHQELV